MVLERAAKQCGSRLQYRPTAGGLHEFGLRVAALLQRRLGADAAFEFAPLPLKPVAFRVAILFLLAEVFVPALQFRQTRRGGVRIERVHLLDQPRFVDPVGEIGETEPLLAERLGEAGTLGLARQQGRRIGASGADCAARVAIVSFALSKRARASSSALPSRLPQLGRRMPLCFGRPRRNKTLVQETRGRLRRQIRSRGRAALDERAGFGLEVVHVSLDAGDAAHPVAVVFAVVERLVPNLQGRLGAFDRRVGFKTEGGDCDDPATTPIRQEGRRRRRLRLSLPRDADALRRTGSQGRAISPRRA